MESSSFHPPLVQRCLIHLLDLRAILSFPTRAFLRLRKLPVTRGRHLLASFPLAQNGTNHYSGIFRPFWVGKKGELWDSGSVKKVDSWLLISRGFSLTKSLHFFLPFEKRQKRQGRGCHGSNSPAVSHCPMAEGIPWLNISVVWIN